MTHSDKLGQNDLAYHLLMEHGPWPHGLSFGFLPPESIATIHGLLTHTESTPPDSPERRSWLQGRMVGEMLAGAILTGGSQDTAFVAGFGYGIHETAGPIPGHHLGGVWDENRHHLRSELIKTQPTQV
jgi:hypothetical protein